MGTFPFSDCFIGDEPNAEIIFWEARRNPQLREILDSYFDRAIAKHIQWPIQIGDRAMSYELFKLTAKSYGISLWELNYVYEAGAVGVSPDGKVIRVDLMCTDQEKLAIAEPAGDLPI